MEALYHIGE